MREMDSRSGEEMETGYPAASASVSPLATNIEPERHPSLPWDVLDRIQACLPTSHCFRSCLVCKRWRANLQVPVLRELHSRIGLQEQWILIFPYHDKVDIGKKLPSPYVYHPLSYRWHEWPIGSVASKPVLGIFGMGEGLICFEEAMVPDADGLTRNCIVVCDPLRSSRKLLPRPALDLPAQIYEISVIGFDVDRRNRSYKVFAACICTDDEQNSTTVVFDSTKEGWVALGPWIESPSDYHFLRSVLCEGRLFLLRYTLSEMHERTYTLVMNNLEQGVWQELPAKMPEQLFCVCPYLINYKGRILMFGVTPWDAHEKASGKIWELDKELNNWVDVANAPVLQRAPVSLFIVSWE